MKKNNLNNHITYTSPCIGECLLLRELQDEFLSLDILAKGVYIKARSHELLVPCNCILTYVSNDYSKFCFIDEFENEILLILKDNNLVISDFVYSVGYEFKHKEKLCSINFDGDYCNIMLLVLNYETVKNFKELNTYNNVDHNTCVIEFYK